MALHKYKLSQPDGPGSSMHETLALFDTEKETIAHLINLNEYDLGNLFVTNFKTGDCCYADWFLDGIELDK